jgi:exosome complex RNA-binding protein Rrp4
MEVDQTLNQAYPGKLLVPNTSVIPGEGTYIYLGKIYANIKGTVEVIPKRSWNNQDDQDKITVKPLES